MVLKSYKGKFNSGNTIRSTGHKRPLPTVVRQVVKAEGCYHDDVGNGYILANQRSCIDDGNLSGDGICYSLNKKARWNLPQTIKNKINDPDLETDECSVTLVERNNLFRHGKDVKISTHTNSPKSTKLKSRKQKDKSGSDLHIHNDDVYDLFHKDDNEKRKKKNRKSGKSRKYKSDNTQAADINDDCVTKVQYDVFYTPPSDSAYSYMPKNLTAGHVSNGRAKGAKGKAGYKRHLVSREEYYLANGRWDFDDYCEDYEEVVFAECDDERSHISSSPSFGDLITEALYQKSLNSTEQMHLSSPVRKLNMNTNNTSDDCNKKHIVYVERDIMDDAADIPETVSAPPFTIPDIFSIPVPVRILRHDLLPDHLLEAYSATYEESESLPRRFSIDITRQVTSVCSQHSVQVIRDLFWKADLTTYVVIETRNPSESLIHQPTLVYVNGHFDVDHLRLDTISPTENYTLAQTIQKAAECILTLPQTAFISKTRSANQVPKVHQPGDLISAFHEYRTASLSSPESLKITHHQASKHDQKISKISDDYEMMCDTTCSICCDTISLDDDSIVTVTALKTCGHYFCNNCWQGHLVAAIANGLTCLTCPEYKCQATVDRTTALTVLPYRLYLQQLKYVEERTVSSDPAIKRCPNSQCDCVLVTQSSGNDWSSLSIECRCGHNFCFGCLQEAHWPASCDQYQIYLHKLKMNGDVNLKRMKSSECKVRIKKCPSCKNGIQKNGGCNCMTCSCGYVFCWRCLQKYNNHGPGDCVPKQHQKLELVDIPVYKIASSLRSKMYVLSVCHRTAQNPRQLRTLKQNAQRLLTKIKIKHDNNSIIDNCENSATSAIVTLSENTLKRRRDLQMQLQVAVHTTMQLHQILEYTGVLIDNLGHKQDAKEIFSCFLALNNMADQIDDIFENYDKQNGKTVLDKLYILNKNARSKVSHLYSSVKRLRDAGLL